MFQMKPALLLLMWSALDMGEVNGLWGGSAQSPVKKLQIGCWQSEKVWTLTEKACHQSRSVWNDNEWLLQASLWLIIWGPQDTECQGIFSDALHPGTSSSSL